MVWRSLITSCLQAFQPTLTANLRVCSRSDVFTSGTGHPQSACASKSSFALKSLRPYLSTSLSQPQVLNSGRPLEVSSKPRTYAPRTAPLKLDGDQIACGKSQTRNGCLQLSAALFLGFMRAAMEERTAQTDCAAQIMFNMKIARIAQQSNIFFALTNGTCLER
jgi:hypothetical protein